jgi:preprotein translocase subunit SecD
VVAIGPRFDTQGVAIRSVSADSAAAQAIPLPIEGPEAGSSPKSWEILLSINGKAINSPSEYYAFLDTVEPNKTLLIQTDQSSYRVRTQAIYAPLTEAQQIELLTQNGTNLTIQRDVIGTADIGLSVSEVPQNNIRKGLDLAGGTRVLLQPEEAISPQDSELLVENIRQRLNIFGISDVVVRDVTDFTGETYILVEIAGVNQDEVRELLSQQGKFEAFIGDELVFQGGDDVVYVCRSPTCSGIDPQSGCGQLAPGNNVCNFRFTISLSAEAAQTMADATNALDVVFDGPESFLSENITLFLDDEPVNSLRIGSGLQGTPQTEISITGSGTGTTQAEAAEQALEEMKQLQTVLVTGSLPVKLEIIQSDAISPVLGEEFLNNALLLGALALLAVVLVITIRYRKGIIAIPTSIAMISEVLIIMGFAALVGWRIDLAAIAGVLIAVGTGVDDQIVIADETLNRKEGEKLSWKQKVKRAFFIIFTAYFTTVVAMIPLWYSGAGLLKGFALTTIAGVTIGVLITRPAFAAILEILLYGKTEKKEKK